jgi:hypothetical protein
VLFFARKCRRDRVILEIVTCFWCGPKPKTLATWNMKTKKLVQRMLAFLLFLQVGQVGRKSRAAEADVVVQAATLSVLSPGGAQKVVNSKELVWGQGAKTVGPTDGSSAYGAVNVSTIGATSVGSGRISLSPGQVQVAPGQYEPSADSSAGATIYMLFRLVGTNGFNYRLWSTVTSSGSVVGQVSFNGMTNSNSIQSTSGFLAPGLYEFKAGMSTTAEIARGDGSFNYSLSLAPVPPPVVISDSYSELQKSQFYEKGLIMHELSVEEKYGSTGSAAMDAILLRTSRNMESESEGYLELARDPADTNYTALAQAVVSPVIPLKAGSGITQPEADAFNAWSTNLAQSAGLSTALMNSVDRAQGAAYAGDSYWHLAQRNAAVQFEVQLATLKGQEPALRSNVVAQFVAGGFQGVTNTVDDAMNFQSEIATNGLPQVLLQGLTGLGLDGTAITNIQNELMVADPSTLAGSFPAMLAKTNWDSASLTLAAVLRASALVLINPALLPKGQFRFDLPTEPGYTYSIERTDNVAGPSGWATILTTNAATSLLSFTNTTGAVNTGAGYYRASLAPSQ